MLLRHLGLVRAALGRGLRELLHPCALGGGCVQGDLKLDNLRLRPEALAQFNLPITVCARVIGQLQLSIPWQALGRRPVVRSHPPCPPSPLHTFAPTRLILGHRPVRES